MFTKKIWDIFFLLMLDIFADFAIAFNFSTINLPKNHLKYYFNSFPALEKECLSDPECPFKSHLDQNACWGYELGCDADNAFSKARCPGDHKGWVSSKNAQLNTFYAQGDFGYIRQQRKEMTMLCEPLFIDDSSLECSEHMRFCRGRNIMLNFTSLKNRSEPLRYKMDVLKEGEIGGYCTLDKDKLNANADHISPLQSWGPELRNFRKLSRKPIPSGDCDVVIEKPTYILKIDAAVNMYHHFCDFFNLYASLHVNLSHPNAFNTDNNILIWESFNYRSSFQDTFQAFTNNPLWDLRTFKGETVCFKNVVFPLLPRMIFGLFYNTPLIYGCENSGLFAAFSDFILHRLQIPLHERNNTKIRVTLLSRETQYRNILNEDALVEALKAKPEYDVQRVVYNKNIPFKKQLEITRNSDIFIGMHGAGLTHFLFLPEWAAGFELYNCEDASCYKDLARLKGIKYITWQDKSKLTEVDPGTYPHGGAHAKFINYKFNVDEFVRLVHEAEKHVRNSESFNNFMKGQHFNQIKTQESSGNIVKEEL
ncbi:EGF domain-specific O-linked N-acetylglucosamine transferase [Trichogramma pretiosum]|uniref:EGF domain-specific O-linked N-acetylglucosamine transferase n=1 Tax=Trichogramma pretiosum TaxID=7493 RepID=UPI0006C94225|nr:EGF domain-specific O-linked N-acetylglucosamine transferase [Trichogramma pretiosum]XP_023317177.1 EGF domain-specific O-linked N-acetylglucosamine transferase [Trichogramma pretiosum]XP_023317178.1 EGF domain-specific O-linked N-acetylglucosamine transferase [Trichogramma pretiosum]XP_023317179.1 EGF domain-specific O-linked N-acetylglucosamine transferase [Trichogramma pretiosum]